MRKAIILFGIVVLGIGAVAIAPIWGEDALGIVVGVVCGALAAVPTSILLLVVLTRSERRRLDEQSHPAQDRAVEVEPGRFVIYPSSRYPPIIISNGRGRRVMLDDGAARAVRAQSRLLLPPAGG